MKKRLDLNGLHRLIARGEEYLEANQSRQPSIFSARRLGGCALCDEGIRIGDRIGKLAKPISFIGGGGKEFELAYCHEECWSSIYGSPDSFDPEEMKRLIAEQNRAREGRGI